MRFFFFLLRISHLKSSDLLLLLLFFCPKSHRLIWFTKSIIHVSLFLFFVFCSLYALLFPFIEMHDSFEEWKTRESGKELRVNLKTTLKNFIETFFFFFSVSTYVMCLYIFYFTPPFPLLSLSVGKGWKNFIVFRSWRMQKSRFRNCDDS